MGDRIMRLLKTALLPVIILAMTGGPALARGGHGGGHGHSHGYVHSRGIFAFGTSPVPPHSRAYGPCTEYSELKDCPRGEQPKPAVQTNRADG